ncbi:hypothetical protein ILUMI_24983 [Ignelater luminosus]|uniref:Uncharacterized protein n=1 Tax=Ignelater luminosus TaxID=2038154 RepID=A0A8K0C677_IGNLU|nr:hypothetical protein ILUMI_24983 [Ignelater luminosus]
MRIRRPARLNGIELALVTVLGVVDRTDKFHFTMSAYKTWAAKQRGNPLLLAIAAFGIIGGCYLGYNQIVRPFLKRRKLAEAEAYGNYIYEHEMKRKSQ